MAAKRIRPERPIRILNARPYNWLKEFRKKQAKAEKTAAIQRAVVEKYNGGN